MFNSKSAAHLPQTLSHPAMAIHDLADAVVTTDECGMIACASRGTRDVFGYQPEELHAKSLEVLMPYQHHADLYYLPPKEFDEIQACSAFRHGVYGRHKDGSPLLLELTISQLIKDGTQLFNTVMRTVSSQRLVQDVAHFEQQRRCELLSPTMDDTERHLVVELQRSCGSDLKEIHTAFAKADLCSMMEAAYAICAKSRHLGATRLVAACEAIESAGRAHFAALDAGKADSDASDTLTREVYCHFLRELNALPEARIV
jgi:PAS domain S-box-containing protein